MEFKYDDGGRQDAGYRGPSRGDCVIRAIAIATGKPYKKVLAELYDRHKRHGIPFHPSQGTYPLAYGPYLKSLGFEFVKIEGKARFRRDNLPKRKILIVSISRHLAAVMDGVLRDTWDSSKNGDALLIGYWTKSRR